MPSRNINKIDIPETYYHVYARGACKLPIFKDKDDYAFFVVLFARYLSRRAAKNKVGLPYPHFTGGIDLVCYCLMTNHFHMLVFQKEEKVMAEFMRCLMNSYTRYFNFKYKRSGPLFESRYKAAMITSTQYLEHISRYIHLNPRYWKFYRHSSINYYRNGGEPEWLHDKSILELFGSRKEYMQFLADYEDHKIMLEQIKYELADR